MRPTYTEIGNPASFPHRPNPAIQDAAFTFPTEGKEKVDKEGRTPKGFQQAHTNAGGGTEEKPELH